MKPLLNLGGWQEEKTTAHVKVNVRCIFKFFASAEPWGGSRRGGGGGGRVEGSVSLFKSA